MKPKISSEKFALYCRVSTSEQTNENQKIRLLQYAATNSLKFDLFEEQESTRKTRPVKQELLKLIRQGKYQGLIIYKLDRFARSSRELILDFEELIRKEIVIISISDNLDFSTASGRLHFQILAAFAEFERELIRERTIEGLKRAKSQGKQLGRPKGSKDKKKRPKSGYILRQAESRKAKDESKGIHKDIKEYISESK